MCVANINDIYSCVYIYVYMCGSVNMWMMLVCESINACTYKYICVFDHTGVNVLICVHVHLHVWIYVMFVYICMMFF